MTGGRIMHGYFPALFCTGGCITQIACPHHEQNVYSVAAVAVANISSCCSCCQNSFLQGHSALCQMHAVGLVIIL